MAGSNHNGLSILTETEAALTGVTYTSRGKYLGASTVFSMKYIMNCLPPLSGAPGDGQEIKFCLL